MKLHENSIIFKMKGSHLDSFWNRRTRELANDLLFAKSKVVEDFQGFKWYEQVRVFHRGFKHEKTDAWKFRVKEVPEDLSWSYILHSRKLFSKFPYKVFVIVILDIIGLENFLLIVLQQIIIQNYDV